MFDRWNGNDQILDLICDPASPIFVERSSLCVNIRRYSDRRTAARVARGLSFIRRPQQGFLVWRFVLYVEAINPGGQGLSAKTTFLLEGVRLA